MRRRVTLGVVPVCLLMNVGLLAACGTDSRPTSASCAVRFAFHGEVYTDAGTVQFDPGDPLGSGQVLGCDDTGSGEGQGAALATLRVYAIQGVDVADGVAAGESASDAMFLVRVGMPPNEVKRLIAASRPSGSSQRRSSAPARS